jgi:WD40 repeat protein
VLESIYNFFKCSYHIWVGYSTGKVAIYDISVANEWSAKKEFLIYYNSAVSSICCDVISLLYTNTLLVASVSEAGNIKIWDGFLTRDRIGSFFNLICLR